MFSWKSKKQKDKFLAKTKKKWEKIQINKIWNERREITMDSIEIKRIIVDYCEQLYANNLDTQKKWLNS